MRQHFNLLVPYLPDSSTVGKKKQFFKLTLDSDSVPDPCLRLMEPDPDSTIFVIDLRDAIKKVEKTNLKTKFFCLLLFEGTFTSFFKDKKSKRSHKTVEIEVFLTIFAFGFGRTLNMWIRWVQVRIRIRNTGFECRMISIRNNSFQMQKTNLGVSRQEGDEL
jgi:hypothetical protein